jgi:hypothetical protein
MSRGDNENPNDFSHTAEWQNEHAEAHSPVDRGSDPARRPGAYEQAAAYAANMEALDVREDRADEAAGYAGLASPTSYARHAKAEVTTRYGKFDEPIKMPYKAVESEDPWQDPVSNPRHAKETKVKYL